MAPDHKAIFLGIEVRSGLERGPGSWKFNNTLLDDENYKDLIRFIYQQIREKYKDVASKQLLWELIKMEIIFVQRRLNSPTAKEVNSKNEC